MNGRQSLAVSSLVANPLSRVPSVAAMLDNLLFCFVPIKTDMFMVIANVLSHDHERGLRRFRLGREKSGLRCPTEGVGHRDSGVHVVA